MSEQRATIKKKRGPLFYIPLFGGVLLLLIALCTVWLFATRFTLIEGKLCRTDTEVVNLRDAGYSDFSGLYRCHGAREMDLRGNSLSAEDYLALQKALPNCRIRWDIPLAGALWDSDTQELSLEDVPEDWINITYFQQLTKLNILRCSDIAAINRLREYLPCCDIDYTIPLGGTWYDRNITSLDLTPGTTDCTELLTQLALFSDLTTVTLHNDTLTAEDKRALREEYPEITFVWDIAAGETTLSSDAAILSFADGESVDIYELSNQLDLFNGAVSVDFTGSSVPVSDRLYLIEQHPELDISWTVKIHDQDYSWDTVILDFNDVPFDSPNEIEAAVPELPNLERVEMCDTGLSTETMALLSDEFPNVRFVWRVYLADYSLRTDDTYFMPSIIWHGADLTDWNIWPLQYCTDLEALDLGHMPITDLSFLYNMPKIKYLILAETNVSDITPIGSLKDLEYLEIFNTPLYDFSPLLECTKLQDLNISYTYSRSEQAYATLGRLTWLKRLWYCNCHLTTTQLATMKRTMPECEFFCPQGGEPTGSTWRYGGLYYEMRDAFHAIYSPGGTNDIDEDGYQIIIDDYGQEWHLKGWAGEQRWWELYPDWNIKIIGITCEK